MSTIDLGSLGVDCGAHLLLDRTLSRLAPGQKVEVSGTDVNLGFHLPVWARSRGHRFVSGPPPTIVRGDVDSNRLSGAIRAGVTSDVVDQAPASWGLAARGALVETGGPPLVGADLNERDVVWSEVAPRLYAQAAAGQWDPATAIDWTPPGLPAEIEAAVVQTMTYLIENEQAALTVPARFLGRIHPHFREVVGFLATQVADEARHVEVFTRRAGLCGHLLGVSGAGGRASLQTLVDEPEWSNASFLLSVLGEGSFLSLLSFLQRHAPDPVTARVAQLAQVDEARHVSFALGHLGEFVTHRPVGRDRLRAALERRHDALVSTSGLSAAVHDSLVVLAAGSWDPAAIGIGWEAVQDLQRDMDEGRRRRLVRLGFTETQAEEMSALHTKNFM
ncbi:MAG: ferritin-like domain-containing protein [Acidimicrobiales bacterium]|nr:ferritin-like domain-containing protein [Acidimicrobiales bacterium]